MSDPWEILIQGIQADAEIHDLSDMDVWVAWHLGLRQFIYLRSIGTIFDHDTKPASWRRPFAAKPKGDEST